MENSNEYEVIYKIQTNAKSHLAAAKEVEQILLNPSFRPSFEVINVKTGKMKYIDLETRKINN